MTRYNIINRLNRFFIVKDTLELDHVDLMFKRNGTGYLSVATARNDLFLHFQRHDIGSYMIVV